MISMNIREQLLSKLNDLFLHFRSSMVSNFEADEFQPQGIDGCQFNLIEETTRGSLYLMSQERLDTLRRCDFEDRDYPTGENARTVQDVVYHQLSENPVDIRRPYEFTSWERDGLVRLI